MKRKIITTSDGSKTIQLVDLNEQYHSTHGALQESQHVFIKSGLQHVLSLNNHLKSISILEIGFGTGLNAMATLQESTYKKVTINYVGVEAYPVLNDELSDLNYGVHFTIDNSEVLFQDIHKCTWDKSHKITPHFFLEKQQKLFSEISDKNCFNLIYFDAFGFRVQPEHWTEAIFIKMFDALKPGGVLVTYSAKGSVRRAMQAVGFTVERLPGPPGKREMLRALKEA